SGNSSRLIRSRPFPGSLHGRRGGAMKTVTLQGGHFRARLAQQRFATRLFIPSALGFVLLLLSSAAAAQQQLSRFELTASVRAAQRSLDLPLFREHAMALLARAQARGLLAE